MEFDYESFMGMMKGTIYSIRDFVPVYAPKKGGYPGSIGSGSVCLDVLHWM